MAVLPLLSDASVGPFTALNPYRLWWAVVLIADLSLCGHVAMRIGGAQRGVLWTGLLGGLASSTAATLALGRKVRVHPSLLDPCAAGALSACAVMFFRVEMPPLDLTMTLGFGLYLAVTSVLLELGVRWLGHSALQGITLLSGLAGGAVLMLAPSSV